ncbi:MAG: hypothetical protein ACTS2F_17895 [Thainema sp.]
MSKSKRNNKKYFHKSSDKLELVEFGFNFGSRSQKEIDELLEKIGKSNDTKFDSCLNRALEIVASVDPLHLISVLAVYGLYVGTNKSGKIFEKDSMIRQNHIELIQAFALYVVLERHCEPMPPDQVQEIWNLLPTLNRAFNSKRLAQIKDVKSKEKRAILEIQEWLRLHTSSVRNWGYYRNVISISKRLYADADFLFKESIGLEATTIIDIFDCLVFYSEQVVSERLQKMRTIFKSKTAEEAITRYYQTYNLPGSLEEAVDFVKDKDIREVQFLILSHSDLALAHYFSFTLEQLSDSLDIPAQSLELALSRLSYQFGDLKDSNPEHFFLSNPIWSKPLVKLSSGSYFCAMPQLFFSFIFQTIDSLLSTEKLKEVQDKYRSKFLEDEIAKLFEWAFPEGVFVKNFKWKDADIEYETDLLAQIDDYILIVEAKSGSVSRAALRGAPGSAKDDIQELLLDPAIQSKRFEDKLKTLKYDQVTAERLKALGLNIDRIDKIVRLSITLEDFATIQSRIASLKNTGWIDKVSFTIPTILFADLEVIFDILPYKAQKIHYLVQRTYLEQHINYAGNELDLLGLYLETGFSLNEEEFGINGKRELVLLDMSEKIDEYYMALDQDIHRKKPSQKLVQWWHAILNKLEEQRPYNWLEMSAILLSISLDSQRDAERGLKRIMRSVKKTWRKPGRTDSVITYLPQKREAAGFLAFRELQKDQSHDFMQNLASGLFIDLDIERCLVIGVNIDEQNWYPYSTLEIFYRD